ncbi:hypothetical protein M378DRAFT_9292 [Amanita muscaria Koide BX008]|uniref:Macro domain-containing protein n=1 Tax=Amanita muscaria (strain Koide BX008) TaxID=946122 RepID=A0A0C2TKK6_AMAMK|nr:hypothetical protein M378DRAFT_9292 [Amanita muscaria Koide BX008]
MPVPLDHIPTLTRLYRDSILRATSTVKYGHNPTLLDRISLLQGDITTIEVDAIVNAANKSLLGGGGVDGSIHRSGGPGITNECRRLNGCATGQAKITCGYDLPARHVIHTVGPVYNESRKEECAELLASCYRSSLQLASEYQLAHVVGVSAIETLLRVIEIFQAFPAVSTGVYGYPIRDATRIALDEVRKYCEAGLGEKLERVIFVVFTDTDNTVFKSLIPEYFPPQQQ